MRSLRNPSQMRLVGEAFHVVIRNEEFEVERPIVISRAMSGGGGVLHGFVRTLRTVVCQDTDACVETGISLHEKSA